MQKKHGLILLAVGLPLLGMMGCTGLLVVGGVVAAASQSQGRSGRVARSMPSYQPSMNSDREDSYSDDSRGDSPSYSNGGQEFPQYQGQDQVAEGGGGGMYPTGGMSEGGSYSGGDVPAYDAMANTPGMRGFDQMILDQSDIQNNQTGEVSRDVDNSIAYPAIEGGGYSAVTADAPAPAPAADAGGASE